ncbi:MAG: hypothetical protein NkDv07_0286 [Candidatus Improbicoccus devescovinae]|nr:MAG: hypothetical protein NkDv07_0286 [Candidatus Improbicoccus devescovinae]
MAFCLRRPCDFGLSECRYPDHGFIFTYKYTRARAIRGNLCVSICYIVHQTRFLVITTVSEISDAAYISPMSNRTAKCTLYSINQVSDGLIIRAVCGAKMVQKSISLKSQADNNGQRGLAVCYNLSPGPYFATKWSVVRYRWAWCGGIILVKM